MSKRDAQKARSSYHSSENVASEANTGTFTAAGEQYEYIAESDGQLDERANATLTAGGVEFAYRELGTNNMPDTAGCSSTTRTSCPRRWSSLHDEPGRRSSRAGSARRARDPD